MRTTKREAHTLHPCPEWDGLMIDLTDPEFDVCRCFEIPEKVRDGLTDLRNRYLALWSQHDRSGDKEAAP